MKHHNPISLIILSLTTLLTLSSCQTKEDTHDPFFDTYYITDMGLNVSTAHQSGGITVPAKFNAVTGTLTPLCEDPLCTHTVDSDCPFIGYSKNNSYYEDGILYYWVNRTNTAGFQNELMAYNMETAASHVVVTDEELNEFFAESGAESTGYNYQFANGYYYRRLRDDNDNTIGYCRVRLSDGSIEEIPDDTVVPSAYYKNGQYIFVEYNGGIANGFYLADETGEPGNDHDVHLADKQIAILFDEEITDDTLLYCTIRRDENGAWLWEEMTLWAYNIEAREEHVVIESFPDVYLVRVGGYVYYTLYLDDAPVIGINENYNGKEVVNRSGGILWRTDIETGETEKAFELPAYTLIGTDIHRVGERVVIGYQNTDYSDYIVETTDRGEWYQYKETTGRIVFDTAAGTVGIYEEEEVENGSTIISD